MVQLFILSSIFALLTICITLIFSRRARDRFLARWIARTVGVLAFFGFFIVLSLSILTYYHVFPGKVADIHLSNGSQHVYFLQMSHIATEKFYQEKEEKIYALSQSGAVILVEGVHPGTPQNTDTFHEKLNFKFTDTLYTQIASFIGLSAQNTDMLFSRVDPSLLRSVDLSIDTLVEIMQHTKPLPAMTTSGSIFDIEQAIIQFQKQATPREIQFYRFTIRSILNAFLKHSDVLVRTGQPFSPEVMNAILDARNAPIIEYIIQHPDETIVIPYGALHFDGVFSALKAHDTRWHIVDVVSHAPYQE